MCVRGTGGSDECPQSPLQYKRSCVLPGEERARRKVGGHAGGHPQEGRAGDTWLVLHPSCSVLCTI